MKGWSVASSPAGIPASAATASVSTFFTSSSVMFLVFISGRDLPVFR